MPMKKYFAFINRYPIFLAFLCCLPYWTYLFFHAQMIIQQDAIGYESLGRLIWEQGWKSYFTTGPNREPLYPALISLSMGLSHLTGIFYQKILTLIQFGFLALTQILIGKMLLKLKVRPPIIALSLLYFGFSPALVNSALSLYSEIATYPFVMGIILSSLAIWEKAQRDENLLPHFLLLVFCFLGVSFVKAAFTVIFPFYIVVMALLLLRISASYPSQKYKGLSYLLMALFLFYFPITAYKFTNKRYNGSFVFTNRGAWALYGNTKRRSQPLTFKKAMTALAYAAGEGACHTFFTKKECDFWSFRQSDAYGYAALKTLTQNGLSADARNRLLIQKSLQLALQHPFTYLFLMGVEGIKLFFWESTRIGFVRYSPRMEALFSFRPFKNGLRLIMSILTFSAFFYAIGFVWRNRLNLMGGKTSNGQEIILFFCITLIFLFIFVHSFFFVLTRYAFPITPLYFILIAFFINAFIQRFQPQSEDYA